ncbi:unnamed protein product [Dovyalis caffra]|uniref:Uncharacterized protein n=1 Tax=Dovyalis caffra TaxID=77055 RepID=A0AAV1RKJ9_9ROSI|nr:unnamed protein product [Dovyalis caffra]
MAVRHLISTSDLNNEILTDLGKGGGRKEEEEEYVLINKKGKWGPRRSPLNSGFARAVRELGPTEKQAHARPCKNEKQYC